MQVLSINVSCPYNVHPSFSVFPVLYELYVLRGPVIYKLSVTRKYVLCGFVRLGTPETSGGKDHG